jgi:hypothetical protein
MTKTPMMFIDRMTFREIVRITCAILRNHFFYSEELIKRFLAYFTDEFTSALVNFLDTSENHVKKSLCCSRLARFEFTCYFSSSVIRDILIFDFNFNERELKAFDNIVSKYGDRPNEKQSQCPRTNY